MAQSQRAVRIAQPSPQQGPPSALEEEAEATRSDLGWARWLRGSLREADFEVERALGRGAFGEVTLVRHPGTRELFALKKLEGIRDLTGKERNCIIQEVRLLRTLNHPCIITCQESFLESPNELCILTEYCDGGDLEKHLQTRPSRGLGPLPNSRCMCCLVQLALGLHALHVRRILHRDLKSQNILLTLLPAASSSSYSSSPFSPSSSPSPAPPVQSSELENQSRTQPQDPFFAVKLADFGIARTLSASAEFAKTCIGTPSYMAPEVFDGAAYSYASDLWSLGCVIFELHNGEKAFKAASVSALVVKVALGQFGAWRDDANHEAKKIVEGLLETNAQKRWGLSRLLEDRAVQPHIGMAVEDAARAVPHSESCEEIHPRRWLLEGQLLALGCPPNAGRQRGGPSQQTSSSTRNGGAAGRAKPTLQRPSSLESLRSRAVPKSLARSSSAQAIDRRRPQSARLVRSQSQDSAGSASAAGGQARARPRPKPLDGATTSKDEEEGDTDQGDEHYDVHKHFGGASAPSQTGRSKSHSSQTPSSARGLRVRDWEAKLRRPVQNEEQQRQRPGQAQQTSQEEAGHHHSARRPPLATVASGSPSGALLKSGPSTSASSALRSARSVPSPRDSGSPPSTKAQATARRGVETGSHTSEQRDSPNSAETETQLRRRPSGMLPPRQPQDMRQGSPTKAPAVAAAAAAALHPAFKALPDEEDGDEHDAHVVSSTSPGESSGETSCGSGPWDFQPRSQAEDGQGRSQIQGRPGQLQPAPLPAPAPAPASKTPSRAASNKALFSATPGEHRQQDHQMWVRRSASRDRLQR